MHTSLVIKDENEWKRIQTLAKLKGRTNTSELIFELLNEWAEKVEDECSKKLLGEGSIRITPKIIPDDPKTVVKQKLTRMNDYELVEFNKKINNIKSSINNVIIERGL